MLLFILASKPGMLLWLFSSTPNTRQVLPKIQSIIEILSLNLSGLYNKINLCNIRDSSAAKNSMKRQIVWGKGKWIIPRRVNKMQPSQSNWNFPDFSPVPLSKPELFKLTIKMKMEKLYLTRRQICQFLPWLKKSKILQRISRVDRHVLCMALQLTWNRLVSNNWIEESVKILARQ